MRIGLEHEFVFKDHTRNYLDFENAEYTLFKKIIDAFPYIENDEVFFECKSLEKVPKRCYIEGFERYNSNGVLVETIPKGLEIRTLPHLTVDALIDDFSHSYTQAMAIALSYGLSPLLTSWNPYKTRVILNQPLNHTEINLRTNNELATALNSMLSDGIQINVSMSDLSKVQMNDLLQKVNYYAPFIVPFSFSSPFYNGDIFDGLSYRNFSRNESRIIAKIQNRKGVDVLEFGGFDVCGDGALLKSLILLFKGLLLDKTLKKKALYQDTKLLKKSSLLGFEDKVIKQGGLIVLNAAKTALKEEGNALEYLKTMLQTNDSYAARMKCTYQETGDIMETISNRYDY